MAHEGSVFEGRTLDDAVRKGLEALGLSRAEVMITTLQEGSGGFLGFGSRPYKVRVMPRPGGAISDRDDRERPARRGDRDARPAGRGRESGGRGRDERGGRSRDGGRGREERPAGGRGGRGRDERGGRGREERPGRGAEVRAAGPRTEERGARGEERRDERPRDERPRGEGREERRPRGEERRDERPRGEAREERRDERPRADAPAAAAPRSEEREFGRSERRGGRGRGRDRDRDERASRPREEQEREERRQEDRRTEDRSVSVERRQDERRAADRPGNAIPAEPVGATGAGGPDDGERRRRRRGRRGGRGRGERREGMTPAAMPGAPEHGGVATMAMDPVDSHEMESQEFESREMESQEMESPAMEIQPAVSGSVAPEMDVEAPRAPEAGFGSSDDRDRGDRPPRHERSERSFDRPRRDREDRGPRHDRADDRAPDLTTEQLAAEGKRLAEEFLKAMGFEATVTAEAEGTRVDVTAAITQDEELLTGRKGEVRQALQHLLNRMLNRGEGSRYHLQLEVNEFWKKREEELAELARGLADQALANGGEAVTEYLNSQERRIIHMTLRSDTRVKTYSLGTGMIKRIAVAPADFEGGPRDEE